MFRRMIVPLDGSRFAEQALPLAMRLAKAQHGALVLLQVVHAPIRSGGRLDPPMFVLGLADSRRQKALHYLSQMRDVLATSGINIEIEATEGPIAETIDDSADLYEADSIVMASHGQTGPMRTLFGSVAREVVRRSPRNVVVVHSTQTSQAEVERPEHVQVAVLLTDVNDVDQVMESAMALTSALEARLRFVVLAHLESGTSNHDAVAKDSARLAAIEQRLEKLGFGTSTDITQIASVEVAAQVVRPSAERNVCLVMVSHPLLREAHVTATDATSTLFHHPPDTLVFVPARSPNVS